VPEIVKQYVPGEKHHGKDHDGWEYTSHGLWRKKVVWKPVWKKIWKPAKKQIWIPDKKLVWKEEWKQIWRTEKKQIWIPDKKLVWKEAWKKIWVPDWKKIWVPAWKKIWKPVWIQEWVLIQDHHPPPEHHGWDRKDEQVAQASSPQNQKLAVGVAVNQQEPNWGRRQDTVSKRQAWQFPGQ
jgi:hypothetical protein